MSSVAEPPAQPAVQKVFVCYRREETGAHAGRIYDAMVSRFGEENVFMDLELAPGVDFVEHITEVVSGCLALIIVMGPHWATVEDGTGRRRLDDPEDFVRLEVGNALRRNDVTPIPVLVGGARMPRPEELPAELRPLTRRNALEMSDGRWRYDVGRLLDTLDELLPDSAAPEATVAPPPPPPQPESEIQPESLGWRLALEGMLIAGLTAGVGRLLGELLPKVKEPAEISHLVYKTEASQPDGEGLLDVAKHIASITIRRTETLALVGAVLAVWLTRRIWGGDPYRHLLRGLIVGALAGLIGGLIWGLAVYAPGETLPFTTRAKWDVLTGAISGGIVASLIGWLWRPARVRPAIVAGAIGGTVLPLIVLITGWQNVTARKAAVSFAIGSAAVVGVTVAALLLADRAERRAGTGSPPYG